VKPTLSGRSGSAALPLVPLPVLSESELDGAPGRRYQGIFR
jgi:hypothetical protein